MEAIGAASAIIAVLQITGTVIRVSTEYIRSAKNATKAAERLRKELRDFRGVLEELEDHAESNRASGGHTAEMRFLKTVEEPLFECKAMLQKIERKLDAGSESNRIKNALLWPFREKEVEKHVMALRGFKESFNLALTLDNANLIKDTWTDIKNLNAIEDGL